MEQYKKFFHVDRLPDTWVKPVDRARTVSIKAGTTEYDTVKRNFLVSAGATSPQVTEVFSVFTIFQKKNICKRTVCILCRVSEFALYSTI